LSSVRSATNCLSFRFSSSRCRSRRISATAIGPLLFSPVIVGGLTDPKARCDLWDRRARLDLPKCRGDLLLRIPSFFVVVGLVFRENVTARPSPWRWTHPNVFVIPEAPDNTALTNTRIGSFSTLATAADQGHGFLLKL
jgi:hypothetical protein